MTRILGGRFEVLDAVGRHPYARFVAGASRDLTGLAVGGAVFWRCVGPFGPYGHVFGDPGAVPDALAGAESAGLLAGLAFVNLPRHEVPPGWVLREAWDFLWVAGDLAPAPEGPAVRPVADGPAIDALLDAAYPASELRTGHPMVRQWYGVEFDGQLVACAADRTVPAPEPDAEVTGVIGGVAVHPSYRGRGLGALVTLAVAAALREHHDQVGLGVTEGNETAGRLYHRIGFTGRHRLTSVRRA